MKTLITYLFGLCVAIFLFVCWIVWVICKFFDFIFSRFWNIVRPAFVMDDPVDSVFNFLKRHEVKPPKKVWDNISAQMKKEFPKAFPKEWPDHHEAHLF